MATELSGAVQVERLYAQQIKTNGFQGFSVLIDKDGQAKASSAELYTMFAEILGYGVQTTTFHVQDEILLPSGDENVILAERIKVPPKQLKKIVGVGADIGAGTSLKIELKVNGATKTELGTAGQMTITSTYTEFAPSGEISLSSNDDITFEVVEVTGTPKNLRVDIFIQTDLNM